MAQKKSVSRTIEEDPILHTPGAEMPDPDDSHHVRKQDLQGTSDSSFTSPQDWLGGLQDYMTPLLVGLGAVAFAAGGYFLYQKLRESRFHEEGDTLNEGKSADDLNPEKLMGA